VARTICLNLLTVRARTRAELSTALSSRGVPVEAAERVLGRFAEVGLIDDASFAETFTTSRSIERGLAGREIARQLREKGVEEAVVAAAIAHIDPERELESARRLVARKTRSLAGVESTTATRRLVGMLARKGYSPALAYQVVREALGSDHDPSRLDDTAWRA
jgi:regulatory protein